ncbi:MAG TPA: hypothetical protein VHG28_20410 [Longimicrobiaceae bacterium]|nr:hypothetical protein [Longimicrobiaceae bacterium]
MGVHLAGTLASLLGVGLALSSAAPLWGQTSGSGQPAQQSAPASRPCSAPEFRQFDFWVGDWEVQRPDGRPAGTNRITVDYDGCVIRESYQSMQNYAGSSFNIYDPVSKQWHQSWVDNSGLLLLLDGKFSDGKMVMSGPSRGGGGPSVLNRITWHRIDGSSDRLRQIWEQSEDQGRTWSVVFDGIYIRKQ